MTIVKFKKVNPNAILPVYATPGAAGADVFSVEAVMLPFNVTVAVSTGLCPEIPPGFEIQVRPRSGLALKHSVTVVNSPGTVDSDFRGEMKVLLRNLGTMPYPVREGDKIAQIVVAPCVTATFEETTTLSTTERGEGGFGHTGQ